MGPLGRAASGRSGPRAIDEHDAVLAEPLKDERFERRHVRVKELFVKIVCASDET